MRGSVFSYSTRDGKRWGFVHPNAPGKTPRQIKRRGFLRKKDAERECADSIRETTTGHRVDPLTQTLDEYWATTIELRSGEVSARTVEAWQWSRGKVAPVIGDVPLAEFSADHLDRLLAELYASGLSRNSIHAVGKDLKTLLRRLIDRGQLAPRVWSWVNMPRREATAMIALGGDEIAAVLDRVEGTRYALPVLVAVTTGLRLGELLALTWADVTPDAILVRAETSKSRRAREVLVSPYPDTADALEAERKACAWVRDRRPGWNPEDRVFCHETRGTAWRAKTWSTAWRQWADRNLREVRRFRWHDYRHTHASALLNEGVPLPVVSKRLGHKSTDITARVYAHCIPGAERDHLERAARSLAVSIARPRTSGDVVPFPG